MRTTITLEGDVEKALRRLCERRKQPFKDVVNEVLRAGLGVLVERRDAPSRVHRLRTASLGRPRLPDLDNVAEALAIGEGERHL